MRLGCMLINFENGTGSRALDLSKGPPGIKAEVTDNLSFCLDSYFNTVWSDCPFVIIDDGSRDDSAAIIERYGKKVTRFIRKSANEGLTKGMNEAADILISEYGCDAICRFDGDIEFLTPGWDVRFAKYLIENPHCGGVGGCQILPYGAIWALGDMHIHPAGYVHILGISGQSGGKGFNPIYMNKNMFLGNVECDAVMGCLAAFRSSVFQKVGRLRSEFNDLRGETGDLCLRYLLEGYQCVALGGVIFIHRHMEHARKESIYDTNDKVRESFDLWHKLWGFHLLKPDMNAVYEMWKGTPLARNLLKLSDGTIQYIGP
jgi:GT2 family glycosyltransferase